LGHSLLRLVISRGAAAPSPFLRTDAAGSFTVLERLEVINPASNADIAITLSDKSDPISNTDRIFATAFIWDTAGNGPVASAAVQANPTVHHAPAVRPPIVQPPAVDTTPPGAPQVSAVWNEATLSYTVTVTAPADPDVVRVEVYQNGVDNIATKVGTPKKLASAPGQVHTYQFGAPDGLNTRPLTLPANSHWTSALHRGPVEAGWYAIAYDRAGNPSAPGTFVNNQPGGGFATNPPVVQPKPPVVTHPPVVVQPPVVAQPIQPTTTQPPHRDTRDENAVKADSRAYDKSGTRADNQWGSGVMHTGMYDSTHGVQWGAAAINIPNSDHGRRVVSMTLYFKTSHTYMNSGADIEIGWHSYANLPAHLPSSDGHAHFGDVDAHVHVPKSGAVSVKVPLPIAQKIIDESAHGFIFGGPSNNDHGSYAEIDIHSVHVKYTVE
jgi:hypothetical protein